MRHTSSTVTEVPIIFHGPTSSIEIYCPRGQHILPSGAEHAKERMVDSGHEMECRVGY
jgi:hypothetical protein